MKTYIFGSDYTVYAANAESKEEAIDMLQKVFEKSYPDKTKWEYKNEKEEFEGAIRGDGYNCSYHEIELGEAKIFYHGNQ